MERVADIVADLKKRRVLVVGLARSGIAAAAMLANRAASVTGADLRRSPEGVDELGDMGVELRLGSVTEGLVVDQDLVVLSPGVPITSPIPSQAISKGVPVIGELELAWRLAKVPTMAITGTNGKSTTTTLCAHLLKSAGKQVFVGGNIGKPLSRILLDHKQGQGEYDWAVVEVSSFQLEHLSGLDGLVPQVAVWLNLTPDHLDRHGSMSVYQSIKRRMFEGMDQSDTGVFFADDAMVRGASEGLSCSKRFFGRDESRLSATDVLVLDDEIRMDEHDIRIQNPRLRGEHNAENTAAALLAVRAAGVKVSDVSNAIDTFAGLSHRLEPIRQLDGVTWINDSKGTNPDATAKSLTSFDAGVVLIAGGRGKGTGFGILRDVVARKVSHLVLLGEQAEHLAQDLAGCAQIHFVKDMKDAVDVSRRLAQAGSVVLLSPACASFDMFSDFEQRGEVFASIVRSLGDES